MIEVHILHIMGMTDHMEVVTIIKFKFIWKLVDVKAQESLVIQMLLSSISPS